MIIATAGHVDHGKTALVRALTGVDTDRLPEEKKRGLTIDLGFAYHPLDADHVLGFVDVPGHERFVRNMLAGVGSIDLALVVVAADDGVMPQTREHTAILDLLGVNECIAVVSKVDKVDAARTEEVGEEIEALLSATGMRGAEVHRVSAVSGTGVEALARRLRERALGLAARAADGRFRLCVDRAFMLRGAGLVVTGTVHSGVAATGERLVATPGGLEARIRGIHAQDRPAERARAGQRCALNLAGRDIGSGAIARGDWIVDRALHAPTDRIDARLHVLPGEPRAVRHWTPVHAHLAAAHSTARIAVLGAGSIAPGESGPVQIVLDHPLHALAGDRIVIRDQSATRTMGGGGVIDPFSPKRGRARPDRLAWLDAVEMRRPERSGLEAPAGLPGRSIESATAGRSARAVAQDEKRKPERGGLEAPAGLPDRSIESATAESSARAVAQDEKRKPEPGGLEAPAGLPDRSIESGAAGKPARAVAQDEKHASARARAPATEGEAAQGPKRGTGPDPTRCSGQEPAGAVARALASAATGVDTGWIRRAFGVTDPEMNRILDAAGAVRAPDAGAERCFSPAHWASLQAEVLAFLEVFHRERPRLHGANTNDIRLGITRRVDHGVIEHALASLRQRGAIARRGVTVRLPEHRVTLGANDARLWPQVARALDPAKGSPPSLRQAAEQLKIDEAALGALLKRATNAGLVVPVTRTRFVPLGAVSALAAHAESLADGLSEGRFTAAEYKNHAGIGRNFAIELLEFFDRSGFTERLGDRRRVRRSAAEIFGTEDSTDD